MRKTRKSLIGMTAIMVLAGAVFTGGALAADVRFDATISIPNASVRISNIPYGHYGTYPRGAVVVRENMCIQISKQDYRIAGRLSVFTGVPVGEIIRLRRYGHAWFEIGRLIRVPVPVVRAAMNQKRWNRFLKEERIQAMQREGRRGKGRVEHYGYGR